MDPDETSMSGPRTPKAESMAPPTEAELSRIAREAVHQQPDPRLDRHLARLGAIDASETGDARPAQPASSSNASDVELKRLNGRLRRVEMILGAVVVAVGILAVIEAFLLLR
jgi:uncharacterized membrane protein